MKFTEKMLLDNYNGLTNSGDLISIIPEFGTVYWSYFAYIGQNFGRADYKPVKYREHADMIKIFTFNCEKVWNIDVPSRCMNVAKNKKVQDDIKKWCNELEKSYY